MRSLALLLYYAFAQHLPTQPMPGWRLGYWLRAALVRRIFRHCGPDVLIKHGAYFGSGSDVELGARSQIGHNARIDHDVVIGEDVLMGPDVVMMSAGHAYEDAGIPINRQGQTPRRPIRVGNDVWIGTRVVVLPGVHIGDGAVVGANAVVTRDVPPYAVVAGVPAKVVHMRCARNVQEGAPERAHASEPVLLRPAARRTA